MRVFVTLVMIGAAACLAGCGRSGTKTYSTSNGGTVSVSNANDHMTITGSNGEKVEFGAGTNAKMPTFLPLYPGATVQSSFTGNGKDGSGGVVTFHAHAAPADVIEFYKGKSTAAGMAQTMTADMGGTSTYVAASDKTKQTMSVSATKDADGTNVQLTWGTK
jgi:hypothetical protein